MSEQTLVDINVKFSGEMTDTVQVLRLVTEHDKAVRAVNQNADSLFGYFLNLYRACLFKVIGNEDVPESERYEEAFSLFEGEMEMGKATLIQLGEKTAADFEGRGATYPQYMRDFKRAAEFKVDVTAAGKEGGYLIESRSKLNNAASKAKKDGEDRKAAERAARRKAQGFKPEVVLGQAGKPEGESLADATAAGANVIDVTGLDDQVEMAIRDVVAKAHEFQVRKGGVKEFTNYLKDVTLRKLDTIMKMNCKELLDDLKDTVSTEEEAAAKTGTDG